MNRVIKLFLSITLCCVVSYANAELTIQLTKGMSAALPIALIPFANENSAPVAGQVTLSSVIKNDLKNSGQFRVLMPGIMGQYPQTQAQVNYKKWQSKGANDIIIGRVTALGNGSFRVVVKLLNAYEPKKPPLLDEVYTTNQSGLRGLAHHISDEIYQKLTGVRGIFSTKIAYILVQRAGNQQLFNLVVADADGFAPQILMHSNQPIMSPTWMPNAHKIAYVSFERHEASIYLQDIYTGARQLVSRFPGINGAPAFSPSGQKMALVLSTTGSPKLYVLDLNARSLLRLTDGYSIDTEPSWAPDGRSLLFTSNRGGTPQIYRYYLATRKIERVTFDGNYNADAAFLPSGDSIVMMHRESKSFGIAKQNLTSGFVQELSNSGSDESPSISPNGKMVIYDKQYQGRTVLAVVSIDGRIKLRLPSREGNVQEPVWSPFLNG